MNPNFTLKHYFVVVLIFLFSGNAFSQNRIIYVDAINGNNNRSYDENTGGGWGSAWKDLVHALYWARDNDQIWLNAGTYYPVQAGELGKATADRKKSFYTHSNVKIYGGFSIAGGAKTMPSRNPGAYETILSGDIQQDNNVSNNSYAIVKTYLGNGMSVLDGVTIAGAYVGKFEDAVYGGGLYLNNVSPTISNCRFVNNQATQGGAVFCDKSNPTFNSCTFTGNSTIYGKTFLAYIGARGGAVYNAGSSPTFNSCTFTGNYASADGSAMDGNGIGGAICNDQKTGDSSPRLNGCVFTGNYATGSINSAVFSYGGSAYYQGCLFQNNGAMGVYTAKATDIFVASTFMGNTGGGIKIEEGSTKLYNCAFINNSTGGEGGGISLYNTKTPYPVISNCLITGNTAGTGGGIYSYFSSAIINNCTISRNVATNGGGGVYNKGRGYSGSASIPLYYETSSSYQNCIIYGNAGGASLAKDSIRHDFLTVPIKVSHYIPPAAFWDTYEYTQRPTIANCLIGTMPADSLGVHAGEDQGGNILNVNPKFINPIAGNYTVDNCSRVIDAGRNDFIPAGSPTVNLDQNNLTRIVNGKVDIGSYEKQDAAPANITNLYQYICQGGSVVINGQAQTQAGTYTKVYVAKNGCDSVINTILIVNPLPQAIAASSDNCGSTGTLEIKPTTGRAPFSITLNGVTKTNIAAGTSAKFTALAAGSYNYTITDSPVNGASCGGTGTAVLKTNLVNGNIIYVDAAAAGDNSGKSFANAFTDLQSALTLASCSGVTQIFVAKGTYYPTRNTAGELTDTRFATFRMVNGVTIYGGFNQATGDTTLARRNWKAYPVILSGDVQRDGNIFNNVYNVVNNAGNALNNTAVLDGFTIYGSFNNYDPGSGVVYGGGMVNIGSSPTIKNCTFNYNHANGVSQAFGGAMYNKNCAPVISNCSFTDNDVFASDIAYGGAVYNDMSSPTFTACSFTNNRTLNATNLNGGAISSAGGSSVTISNCLFTSNNEGAVCTFGNNTNIINSTFYANAASNGLGGALQSYNSTPTVTNCIMSGNSNGNIVNASSIPVIKNSLIGNSGGSTAWNTAYGADGGGNKDADPKFTFTYGLSACSPARDGGTNAGVATLDLDDNPRTINSTTDMGCYEFQTDLSTYYSILYVDANAKGLNNGTSWANAFTDLSDALKLTNCVPVYTIYVSKGTYYPTLNSSDGLAADYQAPTFTLRYGVGVYGGFSVADGVTTLAARNPALYPTILSGDANKDGIVTNNVKAVVTVPSGVEYALLDGFSIRDGYNNTTGGGSGIFMDNAQATFENCTIIANTIAYASGYGAGAYCYYSTPVFKKCKFYGNTVQGSAVAYGGGVYNVGSGSQFFDCEFVGNSIDAVSASYGAAMHNENSPVTVSRCRFENNIASGRNSVAGGIYTHSGTSITIDNSLFSNNTGGALCSDNTNITIFNSTVVNNFNPNIDYTGGIINLASNAAVTNCVFYGNSNGSVSNVTSSAIIKNSLLQGSGGSTAWNVAYGTDAGSNKDEDPMFKAGFHLTACSPAVNAGTNTITGPLDLDGGNRLINGIVNMGCFEADVDLSVYATRLYVNAAATGSNNGTSWANAFTDLQAALSLAKCTGITEIYVSKGTYYPSANPSGSIVNDQSSTFVMKNNLSIIGGFSVADGITTLAVRNASLYPTILSAEIQQDNETLNNAYNVINNYNTGLDSTAVLDGFTITGVHNTINWGNGVTNAGAIINVASSPKFLNCTIKDNQIAAINEGYGAGMYNRNCSPIIRYCKFINNSVTAANIAYGAAIYSLNSTPTIASCVFNNNSTAATDHAGSAISVYGGDPAIISNSLFTNNNGSTFHTNGNYMSIINCTVTGTSTSLYAINTAPSVSNSIFYGATGTNIYNTVGANPVFRNSIIQSSGGSSAWNTAFGTDAGNNKDVDPLFTADYHLQTCSPALNVGSNALVIGSYDLDNTARIKSVTVDMGSYESNYNAGSAYSSTLYVNAAATGNNDGTSWTNAFTDLQLALTYANTGCTSISGIYVSKGTYYPSVNAAGAASSSQDATFKMKNGLSIIGGFSVADGITTLAARNPTLYPATLSGDIQRDANAGNNVYNVINNSNTGVDSTAILNGFYITDAWNNATGLGGGVINVNTSPKFLNCVIRDNFVGGTYIARGAGMHNINASPIIRNCSFVANNASGIDAAFGAGLSNENSTPKIERCIFKGNTVSAPNPAGGAIYSNGGGGSISNSLFTGNTGTAICADASVLTIYNTTIAGNSGTPAMGRAGGLLLINSNSNILNSIVYGNIDGSVTNLSSTPTFYYCNVGGSGGTAWNTGYGINGGGNKDIDPMFTADWHLQACSPLINAGDNASVFSTVDLDGSARIKVATVDMGSYESNYSTPTIFIGSRVYVNAAAIGGNNGSSWTNAFTDLQVALTLANSGCNSITEIYVSKGTYYPSVNVAGAASNSQDATFKMKNNLSIIGGFSVAAGITTLAARNPALYPTVLSGDIQRDANAGNNVYNVINNSNTGVDSTAILDGFSITGAWNNATGLGGGVINANTSPKFLNCVIWGNFAGGVSVARGAGMHNINASPIIRNCSFIANNTSGINAAFGAGLSNENSTPKIERCIFRDNIVSAPNPAGGAIYSNGGGATISNSLFVGNTGTAVCADASMLAFYNVTIAGNSGTPALSRAGGILLINNNSYLANSIVYGNTDGNMTNLSSSPTIYYSNVGGSGGSSAWNTTYGVNGGANRDVNPLFTSEYHLQTSSPLINTGDNASVYGNLDLDGNARIQDMKADFGAYENPPAVLPVNLISYTAKTDGNYALLQWQTASEQNNKGFVICRSGGDGVFVKLGEVSSNSKYAYTDKHPLNGKNYYKLVQIDNDGSETELGIRSLNFLFSVFNLQVYPNPTTINEVTVNWDNNPITAIKLIDLNGKVLSVICPKVSSTSITVSLFHYPAGTYLLRIESHNGVETRKVVKL